MSAADESTSKPEPDAKRAKVLDPKEHSEVTTNGEGGEPAKPTTESKRIIGRYQC